MEVAISVLLFGAAVGTIAIAAFLIVVLSQTFMIGPFAKGFGLAMPNVWLITIVQFIAVLLPGILLAYLYSTQVGR